MSLYNPIKAAIKWASFYQKESWDILIHEQIDFLKHDVGEEHLTVIFINSKELSSFYKKMRRLEKKRALPKEITKTLDFIVEYMLNA